MTDETNEQTFIQKQLADANARLVIDASSQPMPLDITIRSMALAIAQRHCDDVTVKEGNLYQQLKMDNKLVGPLTVQHVIHAALVFERFLWGEWSKTLIGDALKDVREKVLDELEEEFKDKPPVRQHAGGES